MKELLHQSVLPKVIGTILVETLSMGIPCIDHLSTRTYIQVGIQYILLFTGYIKINRDILVDHLSSH